MSVRFKDRLGRDITCLLLQVYYLYAYIYSPPRLNNTSIIFRHTSLSPYPSTPAIVFDYPRHSGATDEGMTPRSSIFAYPVPAKEEARSKDT
jgi:hypothetical protein